MKPALREIRGCESGEIFCGTDNYPFLGEKIAKTRALLLQGPVGTFFNALQDELELNGVETKRICFNRSDLLYSSAENRIRYRGGLKEWPAFLGMMLESGSYSHVVMFGAERPQHRVARALAAAYDVRAICLEEGYVRPGFITVEEGGNNASSPLAGRMPKYLVDGDPNSARPKASDSFRRMCLHGAIYYAVRSLTAGRREREMFHRQSPLLSEAFCWTRSAWRRLTGGARQFSLIQDLLEHSDGRFYLVPLQVAADANLQISARGWTSARLISTSIASFAANASRDTRLVFKVHPMDRGHNTLTPFILSAAEAVGVADRVDVIDTGSLGLLARHCAGMLTINSTSGLSAIHHGVPLLVLGDAIYAHPELATCARSVKDLDNFWSSGHVADAPLRRNYISWIKHNALKPGDFYSSQGIEAACAAVLDKIQENRPRSKVEALAS